jgi:Ca2+-binding EF-hand superfamily protein
MTYKPIATNSREAINNLFPLYDRDHNGVIAVKNLKAVAEELGYTIT